jgi:hypothetical protein
LSPEQLTTRTRIESSLKESSSVEAQDPQINNRATARTSCDPCGRGFRIRIVALIKVSHLSMNETSLELI